MKLTAEILGISEAVLKFKLLQDHIRNDIKNGVARGATKVATRAKEIMTEKEHIITGNLRRSIQTKVGWVSSFEVVGVIGTDVPYGPNIEALPDGGFLYPAVLEVGEDVYKYVQEEIIKALRGTTV